jgi:hypothetical protein
MTFDEKERSLQAEGTLHRRFYRALMGVDSLGNMDGGKVVGGWIAAPMVPCIDRTTSCLGIPMRNVLARQTDYGFLRLG